MKTHEEQLRPSVGDGDQQRRQFLQHNVLATGSTLIAGMLGFGLQAITSHALHPGQYGKTFAVVSLFALLSRPAASFGRLVAWQTSRDRSTDDEVEDRGGVLLRQVTLRLLLSGGVLAAASVVGAPLLADFLHAPVSDIVVGAASLPFLLATQPLLGSLQGEQRFGPWSLLSIFMTLSRLVAVVACIAAFGAFGVLFGTTLAAIATFGVCLVMVWPKIRSSAGRFDWAPVVPFIVTALASTVAMGVYQVADVILVEHFFDKVRGGQYAAVAAIGNATFFATGGVASVVFPLVAARQARDRSTFRVMGASLALCVSAGLTGTLILQVFGHAVLANFAGRGYVAGQRYLGWYALGEAMLGCILILVNSQQSLNRLSLLWVLAPATLGRIVLLVLFHRTLLTVAIVSDIAIAAFALCIGARYIVTERRRLRATRDGSPDPSAPTAETPVAEVPASALPATGRAAWPTR